ncbi:multidrug resistance protein 3 [Diaporthe eres]|nr:multidrug resistance protein 3 [Diaporthe eres]
MRRQFSVNCTGGKGADDDLLLCCMFHTIEANSPHGGMDMSVVTALSKTGPDSARLETVARDESPSYSVSCPREMPSASWLRKVDDAAIDKMNPWFLRKGIALVQQETVLCPGTISHNILMGVPTETLEDISEQDIIEACRSANAWEFISSLPDGLNTQCGANGTQFSGGQRQRIAIARALIRRPRLLLLDEATSALDTQSERVVQETLKKAASTQDRITIAVAHRLPTIRHANMICVFRNGTIVEQGTHE